MWTNVWTSMHASRMRTARRLTACGVSIQTPRPWADTTSHADTRLYTTPLSVPHQSPVNRQTPAKTLPSRYFVCARKWCICEPMVCVNRCLNGVIVNLWYVWTDVWIVYLWTYGMCEQRFEWCICEPMVCVNRGLNGVFVNLWCVWTDIWMVYLWTYGMCEQLLEWCNCEPMVCVNRCLNGVFVNLSYVWTDIVNVHIFRYRTRSSGVCWSRLPSQWTWRFACRTCRQRSTRCGVTETGAASPTRKRYC